MPTTQKANAPNTAQQPIVETVLAHSPLMIGGKVQQECWANFGVSFHTQRGQAHLQAGQFLPIWELRSGRWQYRTPAQISIVSAFVMNSRYMIRGGDAKLSSHPEVNEWEGASPVKGQSSELRQPGGVRRLNPSNLPVIATNASNYESRATTARAFHDHFGKSALYEGCPLVLACRADVTPEVDIGRNIPMLDLIRQDTISGYVLPLPIVASNEEEVVLKDYPQNWIKAAIEFLDLYSITEVGIWYKTQGDDIVDTVSSARPKEVYRNAINKKDLGFSTLDPDLYERMLPFATGKLDLDMLPQA